jgi:hypothetical protein
MISIYGLSNRARCHWIHVKDDGLAMHKHKRNVIQELSDVHSHPAEYRHGYQINKEDEKYF